MVDQEQNSDYRSVSKTSLIGVCDYLGSDGCSAVLYRTRSGEIVEESKKPSKLCSLLTDRKCALKEGHLQYAQQ